MSVWHKRAMLDQLHGAHNPAPLVAAPAQSEPAPPAPIANYAQLHDHAKTILDAAPDIHDAIRADAYDAFHDSHSARELAEKLQAVPLPEPVALTLLEAKRQSTPQSAADRIFQRLMSIPKQTLDVAEAHPKVLEHFTRAIHGKE